MSVMGFTLGSPLGGGGPVTRTFAELSASVQAVGSWEGSTDITPDILLKAINYGLLEGYRAMVNAWKDYYTQEATFTITAGTDRYLLSTIAPAFYELRHLDVSADGVRFRRCLPHDLDAAYRYSAVPSTSVGRLRYRMQSANLVFVPVPPQAVGRIYWIPTPPQFVSVDDASTIPFDVPSEELLVVHLGHKFCLRRSDLSTADIDKQIVEDMAGLRTDAGNRDAAEPFYLDPNGPPRDEVLGDGEDWWA